MTLDGQTQLVGILGWPVAHSLSPAMHNAAFSYAGLNWRYVPLPVRPEHLVEAIRGLAALGFRGANITVPHKVEAIPLMDRVTEAVKICGAVNTVVVDRNSGRLEGINTDMSGFLTDLAVNRINTGKNAKVVILGAGGAARAVSAGLVRSEAHVTLVNRTVTRAEAIVRFIQSSWAYQNIDFAGFNSLAEVIKDATLIINTTPVGQWPHVNKSPWPEGIPFPPGATVYDTIYRPSKTKLLQDAEAAGLRILNGLGMLVYQGASSFEAWTGHKPPIDVMRMICLQTMQEPEMPTSTGL